MTDLNIKPGETWVVRIGYEAIIYATGCPGAYSIQGAVNQVDRMTMVSWTAEGHAHHNGAIHPFDLIRRLDTTERPEEPK